MRRTEMLQEIREMRFEEVYFGWSESRLNQEEAARILGVCDRTFRRYIDRYEEAGISGLSDTYRSVLAIHPKQKAIIVSGFSESDRVKTAKDLGVGAYVRKPYVIEKLGLAVR